MKLKIKDSFVNKLTIQIDFIAKNNPQNARIFKNEIISEIKNILPHPLKHRQSIYFNDELIRDLIFKGYTITFRINHKDKTIEVFGFVKYQEKP
jgi:plasmid stabilization system protein ParE